MQTRRLVVSITFLVCFCVSFTFAQQVGDRVRIDSTNPEGVPVHPSAADNSYVRWANGTTGRVADIDTGTGWFKVDSAGKTGWITRKYLTVIPTDPDEPVPSPDGDELPTYIVGTWNLEHLHDGQTRGFPENTSGGPSYPERTPNDFGRISDIIKTQLTAKILILNEVNGRSGTDRSNEMDRLINALGDEWAYSLTKSGNAQRIAILYNSQAVRKNKCTELTFAPQKLEGKDIFERDPLVCYFTLLDDHAQPKNDLLVVGVHLASGQSLLKNHNEAMLRLQERLHQVVSDGTFPSGEKDILIGGDFNASRYDNKIENFWEGFDTGGFKFITLSPSDPEEYPATRMAGVPLMPKSQIDYLIATGCDGGIAVELVQLLAQVHNELLANGYDDFRAHVSDHIPVTVRIRLVADDD